MMTPYVVYLDWREFCAQLPDHGTLHTQVLVETRSGTIPILQTALVLTHATAGQVHALRLPVESADVLLPTDAARRQRQQRMQERADLALVCVELSLPAGVDVAPGLLLVPGLYDDVKRMDGSAALWTWTGNRNDPDTRHLVPIPALQDAVAQYERERKELFDDEE
jgi:hypothetical protein